MKDLSGFYHAEIYLKVFTICLSSMFLSQQIPSFISTHLFFCHPRNAVRLWGFKPHKSCPPRCVFSASPWHRTRLEISRCLPGDLGLLGLLDARPCPSQREGSWLRGFQLRLRLGASVSGSQMLPPALYLTADSQGLHKKWANLDCKGCKPMRLSVCGTCRPTYMHTNVHVSCNYFCKMLNLQSCHNLLCSFTKAD